MLKVLPTTKQHVCYTYYVHVHVHVPTHRVQLLQEPIHSMQVLEVHSQVVELHGTGAWPAAKKF